MTDDACASATKVRVIDSHTGGEPTRVVVEGGPDLRPPRLRSPFTTPSKAAKPRDSSRGPQVLEPLLSEPTTPAPTTTPTVADQLQILRDHHDAFRSAIVNEPRGSDVVVGALLVQSPNPSCAAGVIFFNNVGYLGMCGHGTIGLIVTLAHLGRIGPGEHWVETPVGTIAATLHADGQVSVRNVPSFRTRKAVTVRVEGHGDVTGDVAWGGNWFFLVNGHAQSLELRNVEALTAFAWRVRQALARDGVTGADGAEIDHVELFSPSPTPGVDSRNFVLCPGKAYDRSPCGTGTSAKLACLFADGNLRPGQIWRQESIIGSVFEGSVEKVGDDLIPTIRGSAHVTADATLIFDPRDPFRNGIRA